MPRFETRRACDRCHSLKQRCYWQQQDKDAAASTCARCQRLGFECLLRRPPRKAGRPRLFSKPVGDLCARAHPVDDAWTPKREQSDPDCVSKPLIPRSPSQFNGLTPSDQHLMHNFLFSDAVLETFVIGPSFWERHRGVLISQFLVSQQSLKDAYLALALAHSPNATLGDDDYAAYRHASSALRNLRQYTIHGRQGVAECLALGALVKSFTGSFPTAPDTAPICSRTLSLIKDVYESSDSLTHEDVVFIPCLVLPELLNCMMRGSLPTLRFRVPPGSDGYVDRYTGLFFSLLPHLYDICQLNNALSNAGPGDLGDMLEAIDRVELEVTAWRPQIPKDFTTRFTATEVTHMLCQAQVMRLGAMLLIHRLRHPFGTNDGPALVMARTILSQLDLTRTATSKGVLSITLPLLAACFEIQDEGERRLWIERIPQMVGTSSKSSHHVQGLAKAFWKTLSDVQIVPWYNIGDALGL